jgi:tRNA(Ile)-lysidine synthase
MDASRNRPPELLDAFLDHWPDALSGQCAFEVGLSGGIDSMVLLDLLWRARERRHFSLSACHVDHGLNPRAGAWCDHVRRHCLALGVPLRIESVTVEVAPGQSLEAVARQQRYAVLAASSADVIVLAHHLDDQAETVLLQLLRGGGPRALAAMPALRPLDGKRLWRPLLWATRRQVEAYAAWRGLVWVEDDSNDDLRWRRNLLRHAVLPRMEQGVPDYRRHLQRSAALMADAAQVLDEVAESDLERCLSEGRMDCAALARLTPARQRLALLRWLERLGLGEPAPQALDVFREQVLTAGIDRKPRLALARGAVVRYRGQLWPDWPRTAPHAVALVWNGASSCRVPGWAGCLQWQEKGGLPASLLAGGYRLCPRAGGERLQQGVGSKPVKTLLQEAGIAPHLRAHWPLLYLADGRLVAVPGIAVDTELSVAVGGFWPDWTPEAGPLG